MSQRYPCPNPACPHEFTAADLTGVAAVTCPQCGMVIQLRAAATPSTVPAATPAGVHLARAVSAAPQAPPDDGAPIVRTRRRRRSRDFVTYSLVIGGFLLLVAFGIVGAFVGFGGYGKLLSGKSGYKNSDYNFNFDPKVSGWEDNPAMKNKLDVSQLALQRGASQSYFALDVKDYKDHDPTPRELDDEARRKLKAMFTKNLETDPPAGAPPSAAEPVAGQPSHRLVFVGETPEHAFSGEVHFFGNQGLGYWLYTFTVAGEAKTLEDEFRELRKSLALLGERPGWNRTEQQQTVFTGESFQGYRLADATGRWKKDSDPKAHDSQADLVLRALDPAYPKRPTLGADLIVMSLKPTKDPVEAAREHIVAKHERDGFKGTTIGDAYADGDGPRERVGEAKGHLLCWRVNNGGGRERFAMVGIVPRTDDLLVLYGECPLDRRYSWEAQLQQIIESLRIKE